MPSLNFDDDPVGRPGARWHRAISGFGVGVILFVIVAVVFAVGYAVVHHGKRTAIFQSPTESVGNSSKAKPSPAIPFGTKPPTAAPPVLASVPLDSVPAASAGTAPIPLKAKDTEGMFAAKHQKIFGRGCDGQLQLSATGLDFTCESGSETPLHFALAEIKAANSNGIELKTGEKFHFDLRRDKAEEQEIFRNWVETHLPGAYLKTGN